MIKKISSRIVYENKWMKVREDNVEFPDGSNGIYGVVDKPDFALIIPVIDSSMYLVSPYRYAVEAAFWEFPQGSYEEDAGIDPKELALRELQEETGLVAKDLERIGYQYEAYGFCSQGFHIFLAQDFEQKERKLEPAEEGMEVAKFSTSEFEKMVLTGEIKDAPTISAYGLLKIKEIM